MSKLVACRHEKPNVCGIHGKAVESNNYQRNIPSREYKFDKQNTGDVLQTW